MYLATTEHQIKSPAFIRLTGSSSSSIIQFQLTDKTDTAYDTMILFDLTVAINLITGINHNWLLNELTLTGNHSTNSTLFKTFLLQLAFQSGNLCVVLWQNCDRFLGIVNGVLIVAVVVS